ncbi:hypothetical protein [Cohnella cellulosilytica]|uniref:Uncharacterized protein n=1 Tax=Cohnella cellulosilytica TaxID=986710 RepID=A0ABW2F9P8_9BACL
MKKTIKLRIDIREWIEPTKVTFDLTGFSDNFGGSGYFEAETAGGNTTTMTGCLDITAKGAMGGRHGQLRSQVVRAEDGSEAHRSDRFPDRGAREH